MLVLKSAITDPGSPDKTGDDRFGHNRAANCAWVIDAAAHAAHLHPFPGAGSGAAWLAGCLSSCLHDPPGTDEMVLAYFARILTLVRDEAVRQSQIPLQELPMEARPAAPMMWMHRLGGICEFAWSGDCFAIAGTQRGETLLIGAVEGAGEETRTAARMLEMAPEERWSLIQAQRCAARAPQRGRVAPDRRAAAHSGHCRLDLAEGGHVLLVTGGLFRFAAPCAPGTPADLICLARSGGLESLVQALRRHQSLPARFRIRARG